MRREKPCANDTEGKKRQATTNDMELSFRVACDPSSTCARSSTRTCQSSERHKNAPQWTDSGNLNIPKFTCNNFIFFSLSLLRWRLASPLVRSLLNRSRSERNYSLPNQFAADSESNSDDAPHTKMYDSQISMTHC